MTDNDDLLGLGSLWDVETRNSEWDESRETDREHRGRSHFGDALALMAKSHAVVVRTTELDRWLHVRRIGMNWVDGELCGGGGRTLIPFTAIALVNSGHPCLEGCALPHIVEWVPLGAALRQWERRSTPLTFVVGRGAVSGRILGVWRDAVEIHESEIHTLIPFDALRLITERDPSRL